MHALHVSTCMVACACAYVEGFGNQTMNVEEQTKYVPVTKKLVYTLIAGG